MKSAKLIVQEHLKEHGLDGLYNPDETYCERGCLRINISPRECLEENCTAGHLTQDQDGGWRIVPENRPVSKMETTGGGNG